MYTMKNEIIEKTLFVKKNFIWKISDARNENLKFQYAAIQNSGLISFILRSF